MCLDIFAISYVYFFSIQFFFLFSLTKDYRFGRPGVEFYGQHTIESGENAVTKIVALPNEVSVILLLLLYVYNSACSNFTKITTYSVVFTKREKKLDITRITIKEYYKKKKKIIDKENFTFYIFIL